MNPPTKPGWYWIRPNATDEWRMARIRKSETGSYLAVDLYPGTLGLPLDQIGNRCEWVGPLVVPVVAGEEAKGD